MEHCGKERAAPTEASLAALGPPPLQQRLNTLSSLPSSPARLTVPSPSSGAFLFVGRSHGRESSEGQRQRPHQAHTCFIDLMSN